MTDAAPTGEVLTPGAIPADVHGFEALDEARAATEAAEAAAAVDPGAQVLAKTRSVRGKRFIIGMNVLVVLVVLGNVFEARRNNRMAKERSNDAALVADVARTAQKWTRLPDGMSLDAVAAAPTPTAVDPDKARADATKRIRRYLRHQRTEYLRANYSDPRFGRKDLPGRADLEFGTSHNSLNVRYRDVPNGGELRWITKDSIMLDSLNEWAKRVGTSKPI